MLYAIIAIGIGALAVVLSKTVMPKMQAKMEQQAAEQKAKREAKKEAE